MPNIIKRREKNAGSPAWDIVEQRKEQRENPVLASNLRLELQIR